MMEWGTTGHGAKPKQLTQWLRLQSAGGRHQTELILFSFHSGHGTQNTD